MYSYIVCMHDQPAFSASSIIHNGLIAYVVARKVFGLTLKYITSNGRGREPPLCEASAHVHFNPRAYIDDVFCLATVVGAGQCPSSLNNVTIQKTFQASQPCRCENTTRLREVFPLFVNALCNSSTCCTVLNTSIDIVECDVILDVKIDCNCATIDSGPCIRQANRINENLQDAIIQLHFGKPEWKVTSSSLLLEEEVFYGQCCCARPDQSGS